MKYLEPRRASKTIIVIVEPTAEELTGWSEIMEAVAWYATLSGEKLREHGLLATVMTVFLHTKPHTADPWYTAQKMARIEPTQDTGALIGEAIRLLRPISEPDTVRPLSSGITREWKTVVRRVSPRYTTEVGEILVGKVF